IMLLPIAGVGWTVNQVLFPALAKAQKDKERLAGGYIKAVEYVSTVALPATASLFVLVPELVEWGLGPKWAAAVRPAQILCLLGGLQSIQTLCGPVFLAKGRPDVLLKLDLAYLPFFLAAVAVGCRWGINGVAAGYTMICLLVTPLSTYLALRCAGASWYALRKAVYPSALMAVLVGAIALGAKTTAAFAGAPTWAVAVWGGASSVAAWVASALIVRPKLLAEALGLLRARANGASPWEDTEAFRGHD
ncbi:MAG: oligosaccharide flippase family protein, partial [Armatimonadota bacterium]